MEKVYRFQAPNMMSYIDGIVAFSNATTKNEPKFESVVTTEGHRAMDVYDSKTGRKLFTAVEWDRELGKPFEMRVVSKVITPKMVDQVVRELAGEAKIPPHGINRPTTYLNPNIFYL